MIGQPPRIVLIDDKMHHLHGLAKALGKLDSACLPFLFEDTGPTKSQLRNARVIFCDLHLLSDALNTDTKAQLAVIAGMLSEGLADNHGPYVLVIWTEFPEKVDGLQEYLNNLLPGQRPIEFICFDKTQFINPMDGSLIAEGDLIAKIQESLGKWSGVTALLWWETAVANAAADLATTLWESSEEKENDRPEGLRQTLGRLAIGSAGKQAASRPGMSVNEALVPLLADRIERLEIPEALWENAVEMQEKQKALPPERLNTLLHLDPVQGLSSMQRGSATPFPKEWNSDEWFTKALGFSREETLKAFGFSDGQLKDALKEVDWYLVQIRAACDEAQMQAGMIPFALAAVSAKTPKDEKDAVWQSEKFEFEKDTQEGQQKERKRIFLHANFVLGKTRSDVTEFKPKFRIRGSLLDKLTFALRMHAARPGTIDVR